MSLSTSVLGPLADGWADLHLHLGGPRRPTDSQAIPTTDLSPCPLHPPATSSCSRPHPNTSQAHVHLCKRPAPHPLSYPSLHQPQMGLLNPQMLPLPGGNPSAPFSSKASKLKPARVPSSLCACDRCPTAWSKAPHWARAHVYACSSSRTPYPWVLSGSTVQPPSYHQEGCPEQFCH